MENFSCFTSIYLRNSAAVLHKCGHSIVGLAVSSVRHFFLPQVGEKANVLYSVLVEPGARGRLFLDFDNTMHYFFTEHLPFLLLTVKNDKMTKYKCFFRRVNPMPCPCLSGCTKNLMFRVYCSVCFSTSNASFRTFW